MLDEIQKKKSSARARKCLQNNYKKITANIRNELFEDWQKYAESKGLSIRALLIESVERAMKEDGFEMSSENVSEK